MYKETRRMYFAIFDGHGGHLCSDYLSNVFHRILANHPKLTLQPMQALQEVTVSCYPAIIYCAVNSGDACVVSLLGMGVNG